jgi:hypothetical protein
MLTGRHALPGNTVLEILQKVGTIDAERFAAEVDERFAPILRQALIADWQKRQLSMTEMAALLESVSFH